jgi:hypothetical protein
MFMMVTIAAGAIPAGAKNIWKKIIFTEIGAKTIKENGTHLLISNNNPTTTSVAPTNLSKYPEAIIAPIKFPAASGISMWGIKSKNLLAPNITRINPNKMRKTIVNFEFIIIDF